MNKHQNIEHLLVVEDQSGKRTVVLESATCSIGRSISNSIVLDSPNISRHHALLLRLTNPETPHHTFRLIDGDLQGKRSKNGISVNSSSCLSHDLEHGDEIFFAGEVRARYYTTANQEDIEFLNSCEEEEVSGFLSNLNSPFITLNSSESTDNETPQTTLERLASFPELISHPIIEIDLAGNITYLNPATASQFPNLREQGLQHPILAGLVSMTQNCQQTHFVREVAVGNQIFEQLIHHVGELIRSYLTDITERKRIEALLKQSHEELELRVQQRTAQLASINISLKNEIAERKRAEDALQASMATNRALLNALPDWIFRITRDGTLVNFKAGKSEEVPLLTREFLGKTLEAVLPFEIAQSMINCIQTAFLTEQLQILEYQLNSDTDNCPHDYEVRIALTSENEVMAIVRNITERKQVEQDIRNALEQEKQLNELKTRFVAMTSHEFRTPLATILSSAELVEHYADKWDHKKKITHLHRIQTAVTQMTELLNDVLLLGKAEAGKLEFMPTPLSLTQFCRKLVEEVQLTTSTHTIVFCPQNRCSIVSLDEKLLRHILINLLTNAIKYSPKNPVVEFDLICQPQKAIFRIQDHGIGIPEAEQKRLFNSFYRASNVGSISGTGLGLAIVKKAVDLHGGQIEVESQVGTGTTFAVTLPYRSCHVSTVDISATSCSLSLSQSN